MSTFFPHLYEYGRAINFIKEYDKKNGNKLQCRKRNSYFDRRIKKFKTNTFTKTMLPFDQCKQSSDIDFLIYVESKVQKLRESSYNYEKFYSCTLEALLKERTELAYAENYKKPVEWPLDNESLAAQYNIINGKAVRLWIVIDAVLCIELIKILPFFTKLISSDQKIVLNTSVLQNILLTSAYYSTVAFCDVLYLPDGHMPSKYPKLHKNQEDLFEKIVEPLKRIKMTKEEYILLKAIIFCSSKSDEISVEGKEILEKEFSRYSRLLLNHMQAKYGDASGAVRYSQILSVMEAMIYFTQKSREYYVFLKAMHWTSALPPLRLLDEIVL